MTMQDREAALRDAIGDQMNHTVRRTEFSGLGERYEGKVRDTYRQDDQLILVTTDRISAFDHVLRQTIPFKGQVLNQTAAFFFELTADLAENHVLSVPDPNVTVGVLCDPVPVEFVVRGYLAGHAWRTYRKGGRELCGKSLPEGLKQNSRLTEPILTPATKAVEGHDEDTTRDEIIRRGLLGADEFDRLEDAAFRLFEAGSRHAADQGLILVDTKYEFGRTPDGEYVVIDEIHTPDSSRYFYADTYAELLAADRPQRQLSKEFVREWLMDHGFQGLEGQTLPDLSDDFRLTVSMRYIELYQQITGREFIPEMSKDPVGRIERAVRQQIAA